jgi:hypothetical protein
MGTYETEADIRGLGETGEREKIYVSIRSRDRLKSCLAGHKTMKFEEPTSNNLIKNFNVLPSIKHR